MTPFAWFRWLRRGIALLVALFVLGAVVIATHVWWVGLHGQKPRSDVILVLGAAQYDGRPSEVFKARLDHAKMLLDDKVASRIITVGGGQPGDRVTEGQAGRDYLVGHGVPDSQVIAVNEGSDTLLSLRAAAVVLNERKWHSMVIVTDRWHALRSRTMARDLGFAAAVSPATTGPSTHGVITQGRYIARESVAYVYYRLFHRASRAGPPAV